MAVNSTVQSTGRRLLGLVDGARVVVSSDERRLCAAPCIAGAAPSGPVSGCLRPIAARDTRLRLCAAAGGCSLRRLLPVSDIPDKPNPERAAAVPHECVFLLAG